MSRGQGGRVAPSWGRRWARIRVGCVSLGRRTFGARIRGRRTALAAVAVLSLVGVALTGCVSIPDTGPVQLGLDSLDQFERGVQFNPNGPSDDASPEEIVRGFVRAASSSEGDYEVAREFLTPVYADDWDPWLGVLVDDGAGQLVMSEDNVATLSLNVVANVDGRGKLTPAPPNRATNVMFELEQSGGQWRIASAPAGIILDRSTFNAVWTPRSVFFLSGDNRLVADTRWFVNRPTLSTQIVRELLGGPAEVLLPALRTAFPEGTKLLAESVPVNEGTAIIDVSAEVFEADAAQMDLMKQQLAASLQSVSGVQRFVLQVNGAEIASGPVLVAEPAIVDQQQVTVLKNGEFGVAVSDEVTPIKGLSERVVALNPRAVSMASGGTTAAVLHPGGVSWVSQNDTLLIDERPGALDPSLDPLGYVWVAHPNRPGEVNVTEPGGDSAVLTMPWLEDRAPVSVRVSLDGNRLAVLLKEQGGSSVLVAGIVRNERGDPVGLSESASTQLWATGAPVDLDWIDESRFAVLTETGLLGGTRRVTIGVVGQFSVDSGSVAGGVTISGGGSRALLRVLDDQARLYAPQGSGWQLQLTGVDLLAKVG